MAVILYWRERLQARRPIYCDRLAVEKLNLRTIVGDTWPRAVAKQALFEDYQIWFEEVYLPPYRDTGFYQDMPDQLPKPATSLEFFTTMSPLLHLIARDKQTRSYKVDKQVQHMGEWVTVKSHRNFVRLCEWKEHVAAFELQTGLVVGFRDFPLSSERDERIMVLVRGQKAYVERLDANKEKAKGLTEPR